MAIQTKVIQMRHGLEADFVEEKIAVGEFALSTDTKTLRIGIAPGEALKIPLGANFNLDAESITYDDTDTELGADDVQGAISKLSEQIGDVGKPTDEQINSAVNEYLSKNPVEFAETDPTVPDWAKQATKPTYTAEEVGALSKDTAIPTTLPTPNKLTFSGAVTAQFDGSEAVDVEIPSGGGEWEFVNEVTVTDSDVSVVVIDQFEDGTPIKLNSVYVLIDIYPALEETSNSNFGFGIVFDKTKSGLNGSAGAYSGQHVWGSKLGTIPTPKNAGEHQLVTLLITLSKEGRLIILDKTVGYNSSSLPYATGYVNGLTFGAALDGTADFISNPDTMIECVAIGSYTVSVGIGTNLKVYGVRA